MSTVAEVRASVPRWRMASKAMAAEPIRIRIPSIAAARFSIFSCP
jgi:hypothetical protein